MVLQRRCNGFAVEFVKVFVEEELIIKVVFSK